MDNGRSRQNKINMASAEDTPGHSDEQVNTYFSDQNAHTHTLEKSHDLLKINIDANATWSRKSTCMFSVNGDVKIGNSACSTYINPMRR